MDNEFQVSGQNAAALFSLKLHRGDGMTLVAMNWKTGKPPQDFVGFAIEYKEPGGDKFFPLKNRLSFPGLDGAVNPNKFSTRLSPIQKVRWVHFPRNAELPGEFLYRVTPVFMNDFDELSYGDSQEAAIQLRRETYPNQLNVTYTRGFVSSQAFVDRYGFDSIPKLLPTKSDGGARRQRQNGRGDRLHGWPVRPIVDEHMSRRGRCRRRDWNGWRWRGCFISTMREPCTRQGNKEEALHAPVPTVKGTQYRDLLSRNGDPLFRIGPSGANRNHNERAQIHRITERRGVLPSTPSV